MVNLELYKVFYTVAKCGSLTKAAQELYISQPAVSQAVKQLEGQLGVSLFNRTHRGMELSAAGGKLIYKSVEEALTLIENAENKLMELKNTPAGTVRIGATDTIFAHLLADKIALFNSRFPAVRLELISATSPETLNQLKEGKCDVGFLNLPIADDDVKFYNTVFHLNDIFVAGNKFSGLKGRTVRIEELQQYPLLMIEENTVARRALASFTERLGVELRPDIEVAGWDLMLRLAVKGTGVGCVPREYCKNYLEDGQLFELNVYPPMPSRGIGVALPKHSAASFALKQFLSLFELN